MKDNLNINSPLVSIVTVVYNGEKTINRTIQSVLNQTYPNIEYIIVDGASSDGTVEIIKSYALKISRWISEKDEGIYDAMNKGVKMCNGEIIGIINADDYYEPDAVENIISVFKKGLFIYHGNLRNIDEKNNIFISKAPQTVHKLKRGMVINHPATFVNKEVYDKLGLFSTKFRIAGDWNFILNAYLNNVTFISVDKILANFSLGGVSGSISTKYLKELNEVRKQNGLYKWIDKYYLYDWVRFKLLGRNLQKLYLIKKRFFNA